MTEAEPAADEEEIERTREADRVVSLGFIASGLAHQVNNALTPMRLSLGRLTSFELSRRPLTEERMHRIELLQDVREGLARVERIVRELRLFSHVEDAPRGPVDVRRELDAAIDLASHEIRHRARLVRAYAAVPPVSARPAELRQVFLNLLINAVHALPEAEAHIREIRVTARTDEHGRAVVEIADNGSGIPSDTLSRIFEPFFTTRPGKALGLGLAVTRDLVAALDGEVAVTSVVGEGTRARIALPACVRADVPDTASEPTGERSPSVERIRILIVDDDRPVAAAIALELDQHDVVVAESGREALEILRHDKSFDLILCDLMMPEISGMDVYEALRLIDPALLPRVVLMTGGAFTNRARQFLSEVDSPVLEKPFEPGELHAIVRTLEQRKDS
jgi:nitrogen-specific signal transduction histidine kinase/CheY-like chemotaxis protein